MYNLTKIQDTKFDGNHPNGINEGSKKEGTAVGPIVVDDVFYIFNGMTGFRRTSTVVSIEPVTNKNEVVFNTLNSKYILTKEDSDKDFEFSRPKNE